MSKSTAAAAKCLEALDGAFFKALAEPARVAILRVLITEGSADVGSIAAQVPQDRSVVARHLQVLERAGLLRARQEGRHTFYEVDGDGVLAQLESLVTLFRTLQVVCCPPEVTVPLGKSAPANKTATRTRTTRSGAP